MGSQSKNKSCCPESDERLGTVVRIDGLGDGLKTNTPRIKIPGGTALIGTASPIIIEDEEGPLRRKTVTQFEMAQTAVTNAEFGRFVEDTGYVTEAERYGWSFVFWSYISESLMPTKGVQGLEWWRRVDGANWRDINGPSTTDDCFHNEHPVVHVSWNDARAYAAWVGGRLPSELEWEHAARGGLDDVPFPWGNDEPDDNKTFLCNIWQGQFPHQNTEADGYRATAPAQSFDVNGYCLYNMVGNVWEWIEDPFVIRSQKKTAKARRAATTGYRIIKGGSYLCHKSYCYRYRIAARSGNSPDSTTSHMGFRVVWDI